MQMFKSFKPFQPLFTRATLLQGFLVFQNAAAMLMMQ